MAASRTTNTSSPRSRRSPGEPGGPPSPAGKRAAAPPVDRLATAIGQSGLPSAALLRRVGGRLGITDVRGLLLHLPRRYDDLRELRRIAELTWLPEGEPVSVRADVRDLRVEPTFRRRVQRTTAYLTDGSGEAEAVWFGRRFIERRLGVGDRIVVTGRLKRRGFTAVIDNPEFQRDDGAELLHAGRIVPVYRLTAGLTAARLRPAVRAALDRFGPYEEYLPARILASDRLIEIGPAIEQAHYPDDFTRRDAALGRLAFDELLALQIGMVARRRQRAAAKAVGVRANEATDIALRAAITASLRRSVGPGVALTADQERAIEAVRTDLASDEPMLRLLQGDVGSGKTAVAAYGLALVAAAGLQGALLAPTDLLARQHAATLADLLADLPTRDGPRPEVTLLTASQPAVERRRATAAIVAGTAAIVVGTHALLQESVTFARLGLAVVDEQHRFGVGQRAALEAKAGDASPHVLLMTATPIPRTLGQVLYADLDVSDLRTPPEGRVPIVTGIRSSDELEGTWRKVREEAAAGHRTFVVVPLIEEDEGSEATAAEAEAARLSELLAPIRVGLVHGRLKPTVRDREMRRFRDGELDVLVGTTVVEVGVDVPEATLMVVLGAERFGLAQLHQLRGRVGRGNVASYCVLVSDALPDTTARARLEAVRTLRDGFALAEADFALRREGDVLGLVQSGLPRLRVASLQRDDHRELAVRTRAHAERMVGQGGLLKGPDLARLRHELEAGWLASIARAEPASGT